MNEWPSVTLEDLVDRDRPITYGVVKPGEDPPDGVLFLRGQDIVDGRVETRGARRIAPQVSQQYKRTRLRGGEVVVVLVGTPGASAVVPDELAGANIARQLAMVTVGRSVLPQFISMYLRSPLGQAGLSGLTYGSVQQVINLADLRRLRVPVPTLEEQRAIVGVLGALDEKIESTRRLIRVAEELGRAELARELAGPSDDPWEFSWPEIPLGSALTVIETGDRPKGGVAGISGGVPSVGAESIVAPGVFDFSKTRYVPRDYFEKMKRGVLQSGDVLLYKDGGTPGNFSPKVSMCQDGFPFEEAVINSHVYRLRIAQPYSQGFLYYWLSSERLLDEMWLRGTGAAIPSLNSTNVKGLPLIVPPEDRLRRILPTVEHLLALMHRTAREQRTLHQLRDALLPELLSGRLRVPKAETLIEDLA